MVPAQTIWRLHVLFVVFIGKYNLEVSKQIQFNYDAFYRFVLSCFVLQFYNIIVIFLFALVNYVVSFMVA